MPNKRTLPKENPGRLPPPQALFLYHVSSCRWQSPFFRRCEGRIHERLAPVQLLLLVKLWNETSPSFEPSSSQRLSRLQQVDGLGYSRGSAFQGAPVQNIQRIPSKQQRFGINLRPPLFDCSGSGRRGAIFSQCFSLSIVFLRAIGITSGPNKLHLNSKKSSFFFQLWNRF